MNLAVNSKFITQQTAGTQQYAIGITRELKKLYPNAYYICPKNTIHDDLESEFLPIKIGRNSNYLWDQIDVPYFLYRKKCPLFIDFGYNAPVFYKNKISTFLDLSSIHHPEWYTPKFNLYINTLTKAYSKYSRHILTISEYSKNDIIQTLKLKESQVSVIYPSYPDYFNSPYEKNSNENIYGDYILAVSSVSHRKNFLNLIKAFNRANLKDIKLVVVGSLDNAFSNLNIKEEIEKNNSIIFTGYADNNTLKNLYRDALFFTYPSFFEGFGIPPLEAMACGCATLVSNATSIPEICGDASYYIDPYDLESMIEGLKTLSHDSILRKQLIQKGFDRLKLFSWQKSAVKLKTVIESYR